MAKSVSLFTMIDGEAVNVGTCHPGQARILRKNGTAEWREGKLWLKIPQAMDPVPVAAFHLGNQSPSAPPFSTRRLDREYLEQDGVELVGPVSAVPDAVKSGHQARQLFDEIDPHGIMRGSGRRERDERQYHTGESFFLSLKLRLDDGHMLWSCDDPKRRLLGYVDDTKNEWITITMSDFKQGMEDIQKLSDIMEVDPEDLRQKMKTSEGRSSLVGATEWTAHLASVLEEALGSADLDLSNFDDMWDRGHKQETMEAFGDHLPISKRLTVASKKVQERRSIRGDLQPPKGWAIAQWPRDKTRINILNKQGKVQGPPEDPYTAGAYRRKATHLVRVWPTHDGMACYWEAATMEAIWEITTTDPETGEETVEKLDRPATGKYIAQGTPQVMDTWEAAYQAADEWLLAQQQD